MQEPYWWYVFYVRANTEHKVVNDTNKYYGDHPIRGFELEAFCPESERYYRGSKEQTPGRKYQKRPLFPNYVFIETNIAPKDFIRHFSDFVYNSTDIIRILRNGALDDIAIAYEERKRFEYLLKGIRYIEHSQGFIVGEKVTITGGPLVGLEGCIKKINRHNRDAEIEIEMFGQKTRIKVALEITKKTT